MLNQLPSDERSNIGVLRGIVQRVIKVFYSRLTTRQRYTTQECLGSGVMIICNEAHGIDVVCDSRGLSHRKRPACEDAGKGIDDRLVVGRNGLVERIADQRSI